jgi:hypothetical protein
MATSVLPDALDLLRRFVTQLENPANASSGRGRQGDPVGNTLQQLLSGALTSRRVRATAVDGVVRALNLRKRPRAPASGPPPAAKKAPRRVR